LSALSSRSQGWRCPLVWHQADLLPSSAIGSLCDTLVRRASPYRIATVPTYATRRDHGSEASRANFGRPHPGRGGMCFGHQAWPITLRRVKISSEYSTTTDYMSFLIPVGPPTTSGLPPRNRRAAEPKLGCEKCHQEAWRSPRRPGRSTSHTGPYRCGDRTLFPCIINCRP
jgi:hypothetical protein